MTDTETRNDSWIMSCNVKTYDVVAHFEKNDVLVWKMTRPMLEGDIVLLYIAKPYERVMYVCQVENTAVLFAEIESEGYATKDFFAAQSSSKFMKLRLMYSVKKNEFNV